MTRGTVAAVAKWLAQLDPRLASGTGSLALEQVLAIDARRRLVLARCGERRVLLLTGGTSDIVLGWLNETPARESQE
jgi:hypothetical protein